jgi:hypothetical protein
MVIDYEFVYFYILSDGAVLLDADDEFSADDISLKRTGYENVTKEQILEILQTHFEVDFGYDVVAWKKYIDENGGWFFHFWEKEMYKTEHKILIKHIK